MTRLFNCMTGTRTRCWPPSKATPKRSTTLRFENVRGTLHCYCLRVQTRSPKSGLTIPLLEIISQNQPSGHTKASCPVWLSIPHPPSLRSLPWTRHIRYTICPTFPRYSVPRRRTNPLRRYPSIQTALSSRSERLPPRSRYTTCALERSQRLSCPPSLCRSPFTPYHSPRMVIICLPPTRYPPWQSGTCVNKNPHILFLSEIVSE